MQNAVGALSSRDLGQVGLFRDVGKQRKEAETTLPLARRPIPNQHDLQEDKSLQLLKIQLVCGCLNARIFVGTKITVALERDLQTINHVANQESPVARVRVASPNAADCSSQACVGIHDAERRNVQEGKVDVEMRIILKKTSDIRCGKQSVHFGILLGGIGSWRLEKAQELTRKYIVSVLEVRQGLLAAEEERSIIDFGRVCTRRIGQSLRGGARNGFEFARCQVDEGTSGSSH